MTVRKIARIALPLLLSTPLSALAAEREADAAARCMAYVAVVSGMDGKAEPDEATAAIVATFGNELMLQGSGTGKSEDELQMTVVRHLVEMNGFVRSEKGGIPQLKRDVGPECERLLASLLPAD